MNLIDFIKNTPPLKNLLSNPKSPLKIREKRKNVENSQSEHTRRKK